jgi:predicted SAM-dependent methyltransferase
VEDFRAYVVEDEASDVSTVRGERFGRLRAAIPPDVKPNLRAAATRAIRPLARRQIARAMRNTEPLRLHLGCGLLRKDAWVNVDLLGAKADVFWDLTSGLPFPDQSAEAVFHEHIYEHLSLRAGYELAKECHRVLRPGGVLRIGVPDAGACLDSYAGLTSTDWALSRPTPMLAVQALFYEHGHLAMYDGETLKLLCEAAGFVDALVCAFGEGRMQPNADTESRRDGTLYVEAVRPG